MNQLLDIKLTDIILVVATLTNVWIVFLVYKLTRKDINPILHLIPIKRKPIENNHEDEDNRFFDTYEGFSNVINDDIDIDFNQRGFPDESQYHAPLLWELQVCNNGEHTATFIELKYEVIIYKVEMKFGIDETDVIDEKYVPYRIIKRKETFEYLAPKDKRVFKVLYLHGEFIQADLVVTSLKSKEIEHITSQITIDKYTQPILEWLSDSHHHRQVIGTYKPVK